jgi:hypothetical protein
MNINSLKIKNSTGKWTQNTIAIAALVFLSTYTSEMASILTASRITQKGILFEKSKLFEIKKGHLDSCAIESIMCQNSNLFYSSQCNDSIKFSSNEAGVESVL